MMIVNPMNMIRKEMYLLDDVLEVTKTFMDKRKQAKETYVSYDGDVMKMASDRYKCFVVSGTTCVNCGVEGEYFYKEKPKGQENEVYHFNLYGIDNDGNEVQFTKDHIIPKSQGGKNHVSNYQTLCYKCNHAKGDKAEVPKEEPKKVRVYSRDYVMESDCKEFIEDLNNIYKMTGETFDKWYKAICNKVREDLDMTEVVGLILNKDLSLVVIAPFPITATEDNFYTVNFDSEKNDIYIEVEEGVVINA